MRGVRRQGQCPRTRESDSLLLIKIKVMNLGFPDTASDGLHLHCPTIHSPLDFSFISSGEWWDREMWSREAVGTWENPHATAIEFPSVDDSLAWKQNQSTGREFSCSGFSPGPSSSRTQHVLAVASLLLINTLPSRDSSVRVFPISRRQLTFLEAAGKTRNTGTLDHLWVSHDSQPPPTTVVKDVVAES